MSAESEDSSVFVDFKGWRLRAPFRCMNCGREVSVQQFCFGRCCGPCDCGSAGFHDGPFSGPRELLDCTAEYFIAEDRWKNPPEGLSGNHTPREFK